jgi:hypothetical protein
MSCNSTVSTVARETNLGTVVPFERWLKSGYSWLAYSAKNSIWCMCQEYRLFFVFTNCLISKMRCRSIWLCQPTMALQSTTDPLLLLSCKTATSETWNLPHFKDMTSVESKTMKTKQFHIAEKHLDKYKGFQSCQTV